jgi:HsdM N-terminal domain
MRVPRYSAVTQSSEPTRLNEYAHRRNPQPNRIWDAFWSGGISNPLEVIEQITYLLFLRRLGDLQALEENKATRLGKPIERRIVPKGKDTKGRPYEQLRWSRFKNLGPPSETKGRRA